MDTLTVVAIISVAAFTLTILTYERVKDGPWKYVYWAIWLIVAFINFAYMPGSDVPDPWSHR